MDLTTVPASAKAKAALKAALQSAGEGLSRGDRLLLLEGAMYGAGEVESGVEAPPTGLDLLGPFFVQGRDLAVKTLR
ncbi:MAG: hypothetical protein Q7T86_03105 [Hyphomicrobiaceae bacterium]|nr:hypothetical protein [Hyphomicrobiaceae bacterium]